MDEQTHKLLIEILAAQVLMMQLLEAIEERLSGRARGKKANPGTAPEPRPKARQRAGQ